MSVNARSLEEVCFRGLASSPTDGFSLPSYLLQDYVGREEMVTSD